MSLPTPEIVPQPERVKATMKTRSLFMLISH
jgi:hypothetical protein